MTVERLCHLNNSVLFAVYSILSPKFISQESTLGNPGLLTSSQPDSDSSQRVCSPSHHSVCPEALLCVTQILNLPQGSLRTSLHKEQLMLTGSRHFLRTLYPLPCFSLHSSSEGGNCNYLQFAARSLKCREGKEMSVRWSQLASSGCPIPKPVLSASTFNSAWQVM